MYSVYTNLFFPTKASDMIKKNAQVKYPCTSTIATPRVKRKKVFRLIHSRSILAKFFPSLFSRWIFFLFHFCFYYSGRYKSNTSTPVSRHAWQLIFREGWVIHTISFYKGYFTIMYERLCVYINMEQNSRTNNRKKGELSILAFWVYGYFTCLFFRCCCNASSFQCHQKN